ncbi:MULTISPECIES: DUF4352 domain-containing protein [Enterococcus]|uniref:DUF4352 domain-containing protein n=1 Tax=Enterococcus mundtii TaxID=53346 RepID=A0A2M9FM06_ENTMU|nr:DUF4352 domain-containing protein [Enterococcus mundtii]EOH63847.1 hypothetical protein UAC_00766 [Enterococcus mundtii ATCC 882]EOU13515.1 hypothetical protein I587_02066 [Enterococcus mundtii ATCC 882]MBE9909966.1 DUF4352 domain-containing protein [Enterococcus mundtii]MCA6773639.1 DUF4352 domain-containing protein [Enterococcus mundtii]NMP59937.1 DUF4352 domain-containing protein [Enterococcus mundtii]
MAKKVMGQDGKMYKVTKPFYKKVWFWVLAVIIIAIIGGSLGESNNKNGGEKISSQNQTETTKTTQSSSNAIEFYKIGDTVKVGDASYTLNSVELTDERNQFEDEQPANVVKINYTVKNESDSDIPVGADVEVYGSDDKKSESYANENTLGSVAPGKQMDVIAHFGLNQTGDIEIHFSPLVSFEKAAIFKATV